MKNKKKGFSDGPFLVYLINLFLLCNLFLNLAVKGLLSIFLTVVEFLMLEIHSTFFYKISPGLPFSMYIIMVRRKNALRNEITEKTGFD